MLLQAARSKLGVATLVAAGAVGVAVLVDGPRDFADRLRRAGRNAKAAAQDPHQAWFVLSNWPRHPWLAQLGMEVLDSARAAEERRFGSPGALDNESDAFRHAYAAGLMTLRAMREHEVSAADAQALAIEAGDAHERDGADNESGSAQMDRFNNRVGAALVGDGRAGATWLTEDQLEARVVQALEQGRLRELDDAGQLVPAS